MLWTTRKGTSALERVAEILAGIAVDRGKVYRYSGDEFVLLLLNASTAEAAATAERLRSAVELGGVGGAVKVTTSVGVVGSDAFQAQTAKEFVDTADKAAHASKQTGKTRVMIGPI